MTEQTEELWCIGNWEELLFFAYQLLQPGYIRDLRYRYLRGTGLYRIRCFETGKGIPEMFRPNLETDFPSLKEERYENRLKWHEWSWT